MTVINSYDKPAGEVRPGNYVFGQKVLFTDHKRVNTRITLEEPVDGRVTWPFKLTDMLEVGVEERTEEERAAEKAENQRIREDFFVKAIKDYVTQSDKAVKDAQDLSKQRLADGWSMLDYSSIQAQFEASAKYDLAREIKAVFASVKDGTFHFHPGVDCDYTEQTDTGRACVISAAYTELDAAKEIVERMKSRLVSKAMQTRVLSRSTNTISNLCEDLQLEAVANFLNKLQYSAYDIVELPSKY